MNPPSADLFDDALCRQVDPELFHDWRTATLAKAICDRCPIVAACFAYVETWPLKERRVGMTAGGVFWPTQGGYTENLLGIDGGFASEPEGAAA